MLGGNQMQRKTNSGRLWASVGGIAFFLLALGLTDSYVDDFPDTASWAWIAFAAIAAVSGAGIGYYFWKQAPEVMEDDPRPGKGTYWLVGTAIGLSVMIDRLVPDLKVFVYGLAAGLGLALAAIGPLLVFVRPALRRRAGV